MKTILLKTIVVCTVVSCLFLGCHATSESASTEASSTRMATCSDNTKDWIATAYAGAVSYPENFPKWALQNKAALDSPQFKSCLEHFASQLTAAALSAPPYNDIYSRSMDIATDAGAPELGQKVAQDMAKTSGDLLQLASTLRQLMVCLSGIFNGDSTKWEQSNFQAMAFVWRMSEQQLGTQDTQRLQKISFELHRWYLSTLAKQAS